jgi:sugar phosphate isomerase/epimerase
MKLILFSKMLKEKSVAELAELAVSLRFDGFDLCVRPGYAVSPDNAATALPEAAALLRRQGLDVPMVTGNFDLLAPDHPTARPLLAAMDKADVRLLKLGYFTFKPPALDYLAEVDRVRRIFDAWQPLARQYGVKICYHTHSDRCMGLNAGSLMHLLAGFDPACLGAYLDPGHMVVEGEAFDTALAMVRSHLAIVAVKDVLLERVEKNGHGACKVHWVPAGKGMVDWSAVFADLRAAGYDGPLSVHCEFEVPAGGFADAARREAAFFRAQLSSPSPSTPTLTPDLRNPCANSAVTCYP